jgi:drug/metabolite transporter (DMT)-like permease
MDREPAIANSSTYAVCVLLVAMFLYASTDVLLKWLAASHSILQIIFFRNLFSFIPVGIVIARDGGLPALRTRRMPLNIFRAVLGLLSMLLYSIAFTVMPLANVIAIGFVAPLILVILCKILLDEEVTAGQWLAISVGTLGALVILQPDYAVFQLWALLPVAGAVCLAGYMLLLRVLSMTETKSSLIVYFPVASIVCTGATLPWVATVPSAVDLILLLAMGLIGGVALYLRNEAYTAAPSSILAPCEYTGLLWVSIFGVLIFGDRVSQHLVVGSSLLVAANLYVLARGQKVASRAAK